MSNRRSKFINIKSSSSLHSSNANIRHSRQGAEVDVQALNETITEEDYSEPLNLSVENFFENLIDEEELDYELPAEV